MHHTNFGEGIFGHSSRKEKWIISISYVCVNKYVYIYIYIDLHTICTWISCIYVYVFISYIYIIYKHTVSHAYIY